ncbi:MAG: DUF3450 family protein [Phycisphaerales bacterium]|jgi:hypothetical protein
MTRCPHAFTIGLLVAAAALLSAPASAGRADDPPVRERPSLESVRDVLRRYVETRRIISKERLEAARAKEALASRIALVEEEIGAFRERIAETEASLATAEARRGELVAENEALKAAGSSLEGTIETLEARTKALLPRLPEPIRDRVKPISQRIPEDPESTSLSLGDRFLNVVGVLNEINKFNGEITMASEVRPLADGSSVAVTAFYLGIGQGYYVNDDATVAGTGTATDGKWVWTPDDAAAPSIARALAILNNEQPAAFVRVPMRID